jgi:hypothetical protein
MAVYLCFLQKQGTNGKKVDDKSKRGEVKQPSKQSKRKKGEQKWPHHTKMATV